MTPLIELEGPKGQTYATSNRREANDLIMLHGWKRVAPKSTDTAEGKAAEPTTGKADEKAATTPANKTGRKPQNKAK